MALTSLLRFPSHTSRMANIYVVAVRLISWWGLPGKRPSWAKLAPAGREGRAKEVGLRVACLKRPATDKPSPWTQIRSLGRLARWYAVTEGRPGLHHLWLRGSMGAVSYPEGGLVGWAPVASVAGGSR
jgi:hypothetical protein